MSKQTDISWCDSTFNPWWGCHKISPACRSCYADAFAKRVGQKIWGKNSPRRFFGDKHWAEPLKWNAEAEKSGKPWRVFCGSMMDVCEDRPDLVEPRARLMRVIADTPHLKWLLLTKRPENYMRLFPWGDRWPKNVWAGATVESAAYTQSRIFPLLAVPASVRFLSVEPMLNRMTLIPWLVARLTHDQDGVAIFSKRINWVICGGESGPHRRPFEVAWAQDLRDQCKAFGIPFWMKQDSGPYPGKQGRIPVELWSVKERP